MDSRRWGQAFQQGEQHGKPCAGYRFAALQGLLTNVHLPKSSLLLVSDLIGRKRLLALHVEAIERQSCFFSYGDAMWIAPEAVLESARPARNVGQ